jgi:hypothetical protein
MNGPGEGLRSVAGFVLVVLSIPALKAGVYFTIYKLN